MDKAWATMPAGSLVAAGSKRVFPSLAMLEKAARYCSATRSAAASEPPGPATASDTMLMPFAVASARL